MHYYRARYYNPTIGRFISEDPIGLAGGINLYAYTYDSPTNLTDPMGLEPPALLPYLFPSNLDGREIVWLRYSGPDTCSASRCERGLQHHAYGRRDETDRW